MNRILIEAGELGPDGIVVLKERRAMHIEAVLGCRPGDVVRIGVLDGPRGSARVLSAGEGEVRLECCLDQAAMRPTGLTVLLALPRPKVMRRLWAPLASLGVEQIILTHASKVERSYFDTHWLDPSVYRSLLIEGLEQSGDTRLPVVSIHRRFKPFVEDQSAEMFGDAVRRVCHPCQAPPLVSSLPPRGRPMVLAVGPEGGWTDYEIGLLQRHGFECVSFGERTLRTDTAVLAMLGVALEGREDAGSAGIAGL